MIKLLSVYFYFQGDDPGVAAMWLAGNFPYVKRRKFEATMPLDPFVLAAEVPAQVGMAMLDKEASWNAVN